MHAEQPTTAHQKIDPCCNDTGERGVICVNHARHYLPKKLTRLQIGAMVVSPFLPPMKTLLALQAMRCVVHTILQVFFGFLCICLDVRNTRRLDLPVLQLCTETNIASDDDFLALQNTQKLRNR